MLASDIEELFRELMRASNADSVQIGPEDQELPAGSLRSKLGEGMALVATYSSTEAPAQPQSRQQLLEQCARSLRACRKRHGEPPWPVMGLPLRRRDPRQLILARMQQFLGALVETSSLYQAVVMCRGRIIASAKPLEPLDHDRLALLARQLDKASTKKVGSTHGELVGDDIYGRSFWYGAALFGFAHKPYSVDFVRHRSKHLVRELAHLLAMLEEGPDKPVNQAPV